MESGCKLSCRMCGEKKAPQPTSPSPPSLPSRDGGTPSPPSPPLPLPEAETTKDNLETRPRALERAPPARPFAAAMPDDAALHAQLMWEVSVLGLGVLGLALICFAYAALSKGKGGGRKSRQSGASARRASALTTSV